MLITAPFHLWHISFLKNCTLRSYILFQIETYYDIKKKNSPLSVPTWPLCGRPSLPHAWTIAAASELVLLLLFLLFPTHPIWSSWLLSWIITFIQPSSGHLWLRGLRLNFLVREGEFKALSPSITWTSCEFRLSLSILYFYPLPNLLTLSFCWFLTLLFLLGTPRLYKSKIYSTESRSTSSPSPPRSQKSFQRVLQGVLTHWQGVLGVPLFQLHRQVRTDFLHVRHTKQHVTTDGLQKCIVNQTFKRFAQM